MSRNIPTEISNSNDILDSRNIQERFDYLQGEIQDAFYDANRESFDFAEAWEKSSEKTEKIVLRLVKLGLLDECDFEEWKLIKETFIDAFESDGEFGHGITFLRDSYMDEDWAEDEMQDLGYLKKDIPSLILNNIDFVGILEDLQKNYDTLDFDGVTYWYQE